MLKVVGPVEVWSISLQDDLYFTQRSNLNGPLFSKSARSIKVVNDLKHT
jgi:hypothetical protein